MIETAKKLDLLGDAHVYLSLETHRRLKSQCALHGRSMSELIRLLIGEYLDNPTRFEEFDKYRLREKARSGC